MFKGIQKQASGEMTLNITSLMDALTIVLIFLVFNFSTDEQNTPPPKGFSLPTSNSERQVKLAVRVTLSPEEIFVEDRPVAKIVDGEVRRKDLNRDKQIGGLLRELKREKVRLQSGSRSEASTDDDEDPTEIVYLEAADATPYDLVDQVMKTAAAAGFVKFRIAVLRNI